MRRHDVFCGDDSATPADPATNPSPAPSDAPRVRSPHGVLPVALLILAPGILAGCAASPRDSSMSSWQQNADRYVETIGQADPASLRETTYDGVRPGFSVYSSDRPENSTDVVGVLVARRTIDGRPTSVYLLGLVRAQKVEDIRVALMTVPDGKSHWLISTADPQATARYTGYADRLWRERFPGRATAPVDYTTFPRGEDRFDLDVGTDTLTVTHAESGATWSMPLGSGGGK